MTPWLVHGLRAAGLDVACLDARRVKAALQMQLNKTDENDAEGLAQIMRTGWYRAVHVKSLDAHRARALLGARAQLVGMTTRLSNIYAGAEDVRLAASAPAGASDLTGRWKHFSKALAKSLWSCAPYLRHGGTCASRSPFLITDRQTLVICRPADF